MTTRRTTTPRREEDDARQREYWASLTRSFSKRFIDEVRRRYDTGEHRRQA